jgi:Sulfotransferase domain
MNDMGPTDTRRADRSDTAGRPTPHAGSRPSRPGGSPRAAAARTATVASDRTDGVDVICAGMYRACSTWQYEVIAHLLEHHRGGRRLGYLTGDQYAGLASAGNAAGVASAGWRVFKSHEGDRRFARAIAGRRAVAVYAYRDVRDVVFSLMHKRGLTFERLLRQGMIHQVLANDRFWTRQPGVLIQRYDEIIAEPVRAVRELAAHVGIEPDEGEAERIADEYSLASNKARTEALRLRLEQSGVDLTESANALICDSTTLLHWNHVRDGGSGSWLFESTPSQRRILGRLCGRWLTARRYPETPSGPRLAFGQRIRIGRDILIGRVSYQARAASQRFPRLASAAKRMLGIADQAPVGAKVWAAPDRRAAPADQGP